MNTNNNITSPNFGMAMRIKPQAKESLAKAPQELLEKLKYCGDKLKDTKFVDLVVDQGPSYHIYDKMGNSSYGELESLMGGRCAASFDSDNRSVLNIQFDDCFSEPLSLEFPTEKFADYWHQRITGSGKDMLQRTMEAIRAIESSRAYTTAKAEKSNAQLNDLFSSFGVDA